MRKVLMSLTILAMAATAAPVSAQDAVTGTTTMAVHARAEPCTAISWMGTLEIDGHGAMDGTYGFALSKAENIPATVFADGWWRWAEYFTVYDGLFERDGEGLVVSCEPGAVLLHGYDTGVGEPDGDFWDTGYVIDADGPFEGMEGARADQFGTFTEWSVTDITPEGEPFPTAFTVDLVIQPRS